MVLGADIGSTDIKPNNHTCAETTTTPTSSKPVCNGVISFHLKGSLVLVVFTLLLTSDD